MKTFEEEISERLVATGLKGFDLEACMEHIKADPLLSDWSKSWGRATADFYQGMLDSLWIDAKQSEQDWLVAQITRPVEKGEA